MQLVEIFLPLSDNDDKPFASSCYETVRKELTDRFGGVTSFGRAPAHGTFRSDGDLVHDDIVVFEVMTGEVDRAWWSDYRKTLEKRFDQNEVLIRATRIERI